MPVQILTKIFRNCQRLVLEPLLQFSFPATCVQCNRLLGGQEDVLCTDCLAELKPLAPEYLQALLTEIQPAWFDTLIVGYEFNRTFQTLIHLLKYQHFTRVAPFVAGKILPLLSKTYDCITAVPLHKVRARERGYNQSALIALSLAGSLKTKFDGTLLERTRNTGSQTKLNREQRIENMREVFRTTKAVDGMRLLLVDDVITTGSTLNACAHEFKKNGALRVDICALATPVGFFQNQQEQLANRSEPGNELL